MWFSSDGPGPLSLTAIIQTNTEIMEGINNHIDKALGILTPPCPNFNGGLAKLREWMRNYIYI